MATGSGTKRAALLGLAVAGLLTASAHAQQGPPPSAGPSNAILMNNVRIFDGIADGLRPSHLLVEGNRIARVSSEPIPAPRGATVVDGGGRVLMPGLSDAHWHMAMAPNTFGNMLQADTGQMYANTVAEAERTLLRGFTTVRDVAGPTFGIKAAIDAGIVPGPRVYPSGAMVSQTAGHGDMSGPHEVPRTLGGLRTRFEQIGLFEVANGVPEVLAAVREQLKKGASQIKIAAGGGVFTDDPLDTLQFIPEEMRAAVQAASDWGTYVAAHVYTVEGIRRSIEAGVRSIEHGQIADEDTVKLMAKRGVWLSIQPFQAGDNPMTPAQQAKAEPTFQWGRVARWAKTHGVKVAFGTDILFQPDGTHKQNEHLTRLAQVYTPVEVLKIATSGNAELFALSGERNPYKEAKLGVLREGAWADMLLVDGDPTTNIDVLRDYERNFVVIMKDGKVYKNTLR